MNTNTISAVLLLLLMLVAFIWFRRRSSKKPHPQLPENIADSHSAIAAEVAKNESLTRDRNRVLTTYQSVLGAEMTEFLTNHIRTDEQLQSFLTELNCSLQKQYVDNLQRELNKLVDYEAPFLAMLLLCVRPLEIDLGLAKSELGKFMPHGFFEKALEQIAQSRQRSYRIFPTTLQRLEFRGTCISAEPSFDGETRESLELSFDRVQPLAQAIGHLALEELLSPQGFKNYSTPGGATWTFAGTAFEWVEQIKIFNQPMGEKKASYRLRGGKWAL